MWPCGPNEEGGHSQLAGKAAAFAIVSRRTDLVRFYGILETLRSRLGGERCLQDCTARSGWPEQGVYFFCEPTERRADAKQLRVVRVGTHAVSMGSRTRLWTRLRQHRGRLGGSFPGGGNHRASIFRGHVGAALLIRDGYDVAVHEAWPRTGQTPQTTRGLENPLERDVSAHIGRMPFLWVSVPGLASATNDRRRIESHAVAPWECKTPSRSGSVYAYQIQMRFCPPTACKRRRQRPWTRCWPRTRGLQAAPRRPECALSNPF